jgi:parvulin-like peptidyl-prolyl isomerase
MTEPNQIRINELARDLEVKAKAILDYLPEAGVTEKKTHSSSIDVAAAEKVRAHFRKLADEEAAAEAKAQADKAAKEAAAKAARQRNACPSRPLAPGPEAPLRGLERKCLDSQGGQGSPSEVRPHGDQSSASGDRSG